mmetsp:Transcript_30965/g.50091  ORF Transcript_30965/g.50091 Transcript_30965/m.50091 type:complete len:84 (+) Transcript_30965:842-1093(+)
MSWYVGLNESASVDDGQLCGGHVLGMMKNLTGGGTYIHVLMCLWTAPVMVEGGGGGYWAVALRKILHLAFGWDGNVVEGWLID